MQTSPSNCGTKLQPLQVRYRPKKNGRAALKSWQSQLYLITAIDDRRVKIACGSAPLPPNTMNHSGFTTTHEIGMRTPQHDTT